MNKSATSRWPIPTDPLLRFAFIGCFTPGVTCALMSGLIMTLGVIDAIASGLFGITPLANGLAAVAMIGHAVMEFRTKISFARWALFAAAVAEIVFFGASIIQHPGERTLFTVFTVAGACWLALSRLLRIFAAFLERRHCLIRCAIALTAWSWLLALLVLFAMMGAGGPPFP